MSCVPFALSSLANRVFQQFVIDVRFCHIAPHWSPVVHVHIWPPPIGCVSCCCHSFCAPSNEHTLAH